jgi:hypothetical protein
MEDGKHAGEEEPQTQDAQEAVRPQHTETKTHILKKKTKKKNPLHMLSKTQIEGFTLPVM